MNSPTQPASNLASQGQQNGHRLAYIRNQPRSLSALKNAQKVAVRNAQLHSFVAFATELLFRRIIKYNGGLNLSLEHCHSCGSKGGGLAWGASRGFQINLLLAFLARTILLWAALRNPPNLVASWQQDRTSRTRADGGRQLQHARRCAQPSWLFSYWQSSPSSLHILSFSRCSFVCLCFTTFVSSSSVRSHSAPFPFRIETFLES